MSQTSPSTDSSPSDKGMCSVPSFQAVWEGVVSCAKGLPGQSLGAGIPLAVSVGRSAVSSLPPRERDAVLQKRPPGELWDCTGAWGAL